MRMYPDLPAARFRALVIDAGAVVYLLGCLWIGIFVHDTVTKLDALGRGAQHAGEQVRSSFAEAADVVSEAPVVGRRLEGTFREAGRDVSEPLMDAGAQGRRQVAELATWLGWIAAGLPALTFLVPFSAWRIWRARRLLAARRVLATARTLPEHRRLLAMRAAFTVPLGTLLRHSDDPLRDLEADDLQPLLDALGATYGVRVPPGAA